MAQTSLIVAVDVGGTKILASTVRRDGRNGLRILARHKRKTKAQKGPAAVVRRVIETIEELLQAEGVVRSQVAGIGVGVPGSVDFARGRVLFAPNLGWRNVDIALKLKPLTAGPVIVENDVNAGTVAEARFGAGKGAPSVVGMFIGTGVGGGIILNGRVHHGADGIAGEIGHIILDKNGPLCGCGQHGCLESFASRTAMVRDIRLAVKKGRRSSLEKLMKDGEIGSQELADALRAGDRVTCEVVDRAAAHLGVAIAGLANVLNPELFVLGGGVMEAAGGYLLPRVVKEARARCFPTISKKIKIVPSRLKDDAGLLGAAVLASEASVR